MIGWVLGILLALWIVVLLGVMILGAWTMIQKRRSKKKGAADS